MDAKNIVVSVVSIAIACLFAVTLLIPVIAESAAETDTFKNEGYYDIRYTEEDDLTVVWDYTNPHAITINDEVVTLPSSVSSTRPVNIVCGDDWFMRYTGSDVQFFGATGSSVNASVQAETSLTFTASNGSATVTNDADTPVSKTVSYTFMYVASIDGEYIMKESTEPAYLNGDSEIYAIGRSSTTGLILKLKITGSIDDGFTPTVIEPDTATAGDVTVNYTEDSSHEDLYLLNSLLVPISYGDNQSYTATYTYFIIPAEVTAERSIHPDESTTALLNIIPLFVVMGIILGAVGLIAYRRL